MQRMQLHGRGGGTAQRAEAGAGLQMPDVAHPVVQAVAAGGVVQLVKEAPASITVRFTTGKRVLSVTAAGGAELPFVMLGDVKGDVDEGTVVLVWPGAKISSARFATTTSPIGEVMDSEKIKMVAIPVADDSKEEKARPSASSPSSASPSLASSSSSSAPRAVGEKGFKISTEGGMFPEGRIPVTGFENRATSEAHVAKHGDEFGVEDVGKYLAKAQLFAKEDNKGFCEAIIDNTIIRVDPPGMERRRVLIVAGKVLRTFYRHDPAFSSDPFTYAIYYTITKRMPLAELDPKILATLEENDVDVHAMEIEEIDRQLARGVPVETIHAATKAPMSLIDKRKRYARSPEAEMARAFGRSAESPASPALASAAADIDSDDDSEPRMETEEDIRETLQTAVDLGIELDERYLGVFHNKKALRKVLETLRR
jgi:hypothetical protein